MIRVELWYEFTSAYSHPATMRIEPLARARTVEVERRPCLLGPLFAGQGWRDSPFDIYPAKGRYMWRDLQRICERLKLSLVHPAPFPQHSLLAARLAVSVDMSQRAAFFTRRLCG